MTGTALTALLGGALAFAESGLGLGFFVPGETAVVVLAAAMPSPGAMVLLGVAVMIGASAGDHVGYLLGRRYGDAFRGTAVVRRVGQRHYDRAMDLLERHGGTAVFATRLVPVIRTLTPAAAGASGLAYRRFLPASLAGSATWATAYVGGGSVVATVASLAGDAFGRASWLLLVLLLVAAVPPAIIRGVVGVRPERAEPDVAQLERAGAVRPRRSPFSPLIGDMQV